MGKRGAADELALVLCRELYESRVWGTGPMEALWADLRKVNAEIDQYREIDPPDVLQDRLIEAEDRFLKTRTTTPLGILRKLQLVAEVDTMTGDTLTESIILGLIRDLKAELAVD
jgi:hypothetical protein